MRQRPNRTRGAAPSVLLDIGVTFLSGAIAGGLLVGGVVALDLHAAKAVIDISGNGLDVRDTAAVAWIFGQMALVFRFVLPAMMHA